MVHSFSSVVAVMRHEASVSAFRITEGDRKCRKGVGRRAHRCQCFIGRVVFVALFLSRPLRRWGEGAGLMLRATARNFYLRNSE